MTGMRGRGGTVRGRVVSAPAGARAGSAGVTERKKREVSLGVSFLLNGRSCGRNEGVSSGMTVVVIRFPDLS